MNIDTNFLKFSLNLMIILLTIIFKLKKSKA